MNKEPLTLSDLSKIDYSPFLLDNNPFPTVEIPGAVRMTTADRVQVLEHFKRSLSTTVFEGLSSTTILVGEYGSGKSHLLKYFQSVVNTELLHSKNKVLGIYVKSVGRNFRDLYLYFIDNIGMELLKDIAEKVLKDYFLSIGDEKLRKIVFDEKLKEGYEDITKAPVKNILIGSQFYDIFRETAKTVPKLKKFSTISAILHLCHPDYTSLAWRWLIGENLSNDERKVIRVEENIDDYLTAETVVNDMMTIFVNSGIKTIVLLVDEFENFTLMPRNLRDKFMDGLRHFIDDNPQGILLVFTTTPFAWTELSKVTSALIRRLVGNEYELKFFNRQETEELIIRYLDLFRIKDASLPEIVKEFSTNKQIFPFTEQAIDKIQEKSDGLVSSIIKISRKAIDSAIDSKQKIIDEKIVDEAALNI